MQRKIMIVVGARPNFMKAAPILTAIQQHNKGVTQGGGPEFKRTGEDVLRPILVHTGQHYDQAMSDQFFADLNLSKPDVYLGVGSASHAIQTAEIMKKFEEVLSRERPDVVVVVGDVNSTVACALVTAKISFDSNGTRPLIAHVEAGLRSFDRTMPEEVNRVVTDHLSDLLFVTEESGLRNLRDEGISSEKIHFVGNTMIDSLLAFKDKAEASEILQELGLRERLGKNGPSGSIARYALLTLHRPSNVDQCDSFQNILSGLEDLAKSLPIIFPAHPRTQRRIQEFGLGLRLLTSATKRNGESGTTDQLREGIAMTDPLGYLDFLCLMKHAAIVVTDSGGIQEETTCLGIPCVTVRENTERPVTAESGTNMVAGTDKEKIKEAIRRQLGAKNRNGAPKNWDGRAASRIVDVLIRTDFGRASSRPATLS